MTIVYIYNPKAPTSCIAKVDVEIRSKKMAWALFMHRGELKRRQIGATAFFSYAACERAKLGSIRLILRRPNFWNRNMACSTHESALFAIKCFKKHGDNFLVKEFK